jgi:hypothetical protein
MRGGKTTGVLFAVLTVIALTSTTAALGFSPPEVGRCVKLGTKTGKFANSGCTKENTKSVGSYEWLPGAVKNKITTKGGVGALETLNGTTVGCNTEESGGEFNSPKTVTGVVVRFTGCHSVGFECTSPGQKIGEIVTNPLEGKIGIEKRVFKEGKEEPTKAKIAFDLFPKLEDGGLYVSFKCGTELNISVGGSVLVPLTPTDKMLTTFVLKYSAKKGIQKPENFEGEPKDILLTTINTKAPEQSGITIASTQSGEESLELNAGF